MPGPKYATAFPYAVALTSQADTKIFKTTPTLSAGDVLVSKDLGNFANIGTLPVQIQSSGVVGFTLTTTEMTAGLILVLFRDAAGAQWCDLLLVINTETGTISEINSDVEGMVSTLGVAGAGLTAIPTVAAVTSVATVTGNVNGNVGGDVTGSVGSVVGLTPGNLDAAVSTRATAATVWGEALPGAYLAGTAGYILGNLVASVTAAITISAAFLTAIGTAVWNWATRTLTLYPWLVAKIEEAISVGGTPWVDWMWERYTTKVVTVQVVDMGGYPVNITGWSIRWVAGSYLDKNTTAATITITAPLSGVFTFTVTAAESLLMPYGDHAEATHMSCKGQEPGAGGAVRLIFEGKLRYKGTLITTV